jgi:hypothetical protein
MTQDRANARAIALVKRRDDIEKTHRDAVEAADRAHADALRAANEARVVALAEIAPELADLVAAAHHVDERPPEPRRPRVRRTTTPDGGAT